MTKKEMETHRTHHLRYITSVPLLQTAVEGRKCPDTNATPKTCLRLDQRCVKQKGMEKLSPLECRRGFQLWVVYIRPTSPGLSSIEQYTCPLLSCNRNHCDFCSFPTHVASCPQLENAEHWCFTCRRYERFPSAIQRTKSKLKRAHRDMVLTDKTPSVVPWMFGAISFGFPAASCTGALPSARWS